MEELTNKTSDDTYADLDVLSIDYRLATLESELDRTRKVLNAVCYWIQGKFGEDDELPIEIFKPETDTRAEEFELPECKVEPVDLEQENESGQNEVEITYDDDSEFNEHENYDDISSVDEDDGRNVECLPSNNKLSRKRKVPITPLQLDKEDSPSSSSEEEESDPEFEPTDSDDSDSQSDLDSDSKDFEKLTKIDQIKSPVQQRLNPSKHDMKRSSNESRAILEISKRKAGTFYCPICNESFEHVDPLILHKIEIHPEQFSAEAQLNQFTRKQLIWKCSICPKYFYPKKLSCINHIKRFHRNEEFGVIEETLIENVKFEISDPDDGGNLILKPPPQCPKKIKTKTERKNKKKECIETCPFCLSPEQFSSKSMLLRHVKSVHSESQFEEILRDRQDIKNVADKIFSLTYCKKCKRNFNSSAEFDDHNFQLHSWKCENSGCTAIFKRKSNLQGHIKLMHRPQTTSICPTCGKSVKQLDFHMRYAHSEPKHSCNLCPFKALFPKYLRRHRETAHGIPNPNATPNQCELCGQFFSRSYKLTFHIKTVHEGIRNYPCSLCEKRFKTRSSLKYHLTTHSNPNSKNRGLNKDRIPIRRKPNKEKK